MKIGRVFILIGILLFAIILYINKFSGNKSESSPNAQKGKQPLFVNAIIAQNKDIEESIFASGTLLANEEVEIRNEIAGKVTAIHFKEGAFVKKGTLLLTIYNVDLLAQLKKLKLQKEVAKKTEERQKDLLSIQGISSQDYELSLNELNTLQADIDLAESQISKTQIVSPFDGIVGLKTISVGSYLPINTKIATIQSMDPIKLEFSVPERYRQFINDNDSIHFTTETSEDKFAGKIYAFEPKIDPQTRSVFVRALSSNKKNNLIPGSFAKIEISLKKLNDAVLIPTQAVIPELNGQKVFVSKNGKALSTAVETGIRNESFIQITSGLNAGDTVLVSGLMQVRHDMPLSVSVNK